MKRFSGFPGKTRFTPIPNVFFSALVPEIDDLAELKVTLHIFWAAYQKRGYPRFLTHRELSGDAAFMRGLAISGDPAELLQRGLQHAESRGTLLHLTMKRSGEVEELYFVNTEVDRRAVEKIRSGELDIGELEAGDVEPVSSDVQPNIFTLYEQNIGMLSPIIADELREAEKLYPASWIEDAFREAVDLNKRSWRYISRILERWAAEGKDDGELRRHTKTDADPEEYRRRYGHLLKR